MNIPKIKRRIFGRYEKSADGTYFIDVTLPRVESIYNDFDKLSPYVKKELDEDIVEYLIDSAKDLGKQRFAIRFFFNDTLTEDMQVRVSKSIENYFHYRSALEERKFHEQVHSSWIHFCLGVFLLMLALWGLQVISDSGAIVKELLKEGLLIASWVSLWNAMDTFIVNWRPFRKRTRLFLKIASSKVLFGTTEKPV